jgi:hypothetical protein
MVVLGMSNAVEMKTVILARLLQVGLMMISSLGVIAQPWRPPEPVPKKTSYEELIGTRCFAFGAGGYSGVTSRGEEAFHSIMATTNALETFSRVLTNGTPEAQLYALCAIKKQAPERFEMSASWLVTPNPKVELMRGCLFWEESASNVVQRIRERPPGSYYSYVDRKWRFVVELK